jgi:hypothetical protein
MSDVALHRHIEPTRRNEADPIRGFKESITRFTYGQWVGICREWHTKCADDAPETPEALAALIHRWAEN